MLVNYSVMSENEVETVFVRSFKELKILLPASVLEFKFVRLFTEFYEIFAQHKQSDFYTYQAASANV